MQKKPLLLKTMSQPWAIRAASMAAIMEASAYEDTLAALDLPEMKKDAPPYCVEDGAAVIQVAGVIGKKLPKWMVAAFGMVDVDAVAQAVISANADDSVKSIFLEFDSPGGSVTGVPEAANIIRASAKPVYAYSENLMASAAYWLASGASGIFASESALVGSVGVFIPMLDMKKMYEAAGLEMDLIKAGALKGAGYPGTSLSAEQRAHFQAGVDHVYAKFTAFVTSRQGANGCPEDESMQGQDFYGDQALEAALVDGICGRAQILDAVKKLQNV